MPPSEQDERPGVHPRVPLSAGPPPVGELHVVVGADWVAPSIARDRLERWLRGLAWPRGQREDLVLALSEAVSNSVEHGYGIAAGATSSGDAGAGAVEVRARLLVEGGGARRIRLVVRDGGRWREPVAPSRFRGHGLAIIRACADEMVVDGDDAGTTLTLSSRAAPPRTA
jgi:anti-sigma regulatory factor (Ser/Thr protein kinase)